MRAAMLVACFASALAQSAGSCYSMSTHKVTCNVANAACTDRWYAPGFASSRSGCCHCSGSCVNRSSTCTYYDEQKGSCYDMATHKVTCDVAEADCTGRWYQPGFASSRSGCCHCQKSCASTSSTCTYYDAAPSAPATGTTGTTGTTAATGFIGTLLNKAEDLSTGALVGIIAGAVVGGGAIVYLLYRLLCRKGASVGKA